MKYVLTILLFFNLSNLFSQELNLEWVSNGGEIDDYVIKKSILNDIDSSFYICGAFDGQMQFNENQLLSSESSSVFLLKLNQQGETIWLKEIAENINYTASSSLVSICNNSFGNLIIALRFYDTVVINQEIFSTDYTSTLIMEIDTSGIVQWTKEVFTEGLAKDGVIVDDLDNIYITGNTNEDFFISKYSSNGDSLWTHYGGSSGGFDSGTALKIDSENNIYAIGTIQPNNGIYFDTYHPTFNVIHSDGSFLAKYDQNGLIQWVRCFYATNFGEFTSAYTLELLSDNQIIVGGSFNGTKINFYPTTQSLDGNISGNNTSFLLSYDSLGNLLWKKKPHNNYTGADGLRHLNKTENGGFVASCSYSYSIIVMNDTISSFIDGGQLIENFDENGEQIWYFKYKITGSSSLFDMIYKENSYFLNGSTDGDSLIINNLSYEFNYENCFFIAKLQDNSVSLSEEQLNTFTLFPNPTNSSVILQSKESLLGKEVSIYNALGELMSCQKMNHFFENEILLPESTGIYFIRMDENILKIIKH